MDIYEVVKPFYVLSRLVGFSWFALPSFKWKLPKFWDVILMTANVSLRLYSVYLSLITANFSTEASVGVLLNEMFQVWIAAAWLLQTGLALRSGNQYLGILNKLADFDNIIVASIPHSRHKRFLRIYLCLALAVTPMTTFLSIAAFEYFSIPVLYPLVWNTTFNTEIFVVSISHIVIASLAICSRLKLVNALFEKDCRKYVQLLLQKHPSNVRYFRALYESLFLTMEEINKCFSCVGFICISVSFGAIMSTLFFNYEMVKFYKSFFNPITLSNMLWLLIFNAFVLVIVNVNDSLKREVKGILIGNRRSIMINEGNSFPGKAYCANNL